MTKHLTPIQEQIYAYIQDTIISDGFSPTVREIAAAFNLASSSSVHYHLKKLEEAGLIRKSSGKRDRTITLITAENTGIPIVGNVAAGQPILAEERIDGYLPISVPVRKEEYFALKVRGDSMIGAKIFDGDYVIVHRQVDVNPGDIVVALFENEATVKTYSVKNGHVWLLPANPQYQPIDGLNAKILGKVTFVVRGY